MRKGFTIEEAFSRTRRKRFEKKGARPGEAPWMEMVVGSRERGG
jgi:hypothetical protein